MLGIRSTNNKFNQGALVSKTTVVAIFIFLGSVLAFPAVFAQQPQMDPAQLKKLEDAGYESDPDVFKEIATGGQPMGRWKEGLTFEGVEPMPWMSSAANWVPGKEDVQPEEIRVTFMGSAPVIRPGQMGTSVYVELGNGKNFIFDMGPGSVANYLAAGIPLNQLNEIFITHLHWDHVASIPYAFVFGGWAGRWHEQFRVHGPSGRTDKHGFAYMMEKMNEMVTWHKDSFDIFPIGKAWEMDVNEFPFDDDGGTVYEQDGVKIIHWRQSHTEDGASAYRLDWNGMCVAFTGDGRPNSLTAKYAAGCDLVITEVQVELMALSSGVQGVLPVMGRMTVDTSHNPGYAAGYLFDQLKPRMAMTTHMSYDAYSNAELLSQIRHHYDGPFHFGAPDMVVVNMTQDKVWVRDGVVAEYANVAPPKFDVAATGGMLIPAPKYKRSDIQQQSIRDAEIPPEDYYPEGYKPEMLTEWPSDKPVLIPLEMMPAPDEE
jgi:ribonuclease Z